MIGRDTLDVEIKAPPHIAKSAQPLVKVRILARGAPGVQALSSPRWTPSVAVARPSQPCHKPGNAICIAARIAFMIRSNAPKRLLIDHRINRRFTEQEHKHCAVAQQGSSDGDLTVFRRFRRVAILD